jgi:hypothetical protein
MRGSAPFAQVHEGAALVRQPATGAQPRVQQVNLRSRITGWARHA